MTREELDAIVALRGFEVGDYVETDDFRGVVLFVDAHCVVVSRGTSRLTTETRKLTLIAPNAFSPTARPRVRSAR